jgi:hypothetical protein
LNREAGNHRELVPGVARPPRKEDYAPIVRGLRPFLPDEEVDLRSSLLLMRDRAMATKANASEYAWALLDVVERVGADHAMNHRVDVESLREMRRICLNIVCAASSFDAMYQPRLPLDDGEANGRGV